jgi:hypothetical protein
MPKINEFYLFKKDRAKRFINPAMGGITSHFGFISRQSPLSLTPEGGKDQVFNNRIKEVQSYEN